MEKKKKYKQAPLLPKLPSAVFHGGEEAKSKLGLNFSPRCPFNGQRDPPGGAVRAGRGAGRGEPAAGHGAGGDRPRDPRDGDGAPPGAAGGGRCQQDEPGRRSREEKSGWEGDTRGSPHRTLRGEQRHRTTRAPSCCGRASLRVRGAGGPGDEGGTGRGAEEGAGRHPPLVPPGRSAGGGGRSLGRMAGRFLKIWG